MINRVKVSINPRPNPPIRPGNWKQRLVVIISSIILLLYFLVPLVSIPVLSVTRFEANAGQRVQVQTSLTSDYYRELFINRQGSIFYIPPFAAFGNSLGFAAGTVLLSLFLGFPVAATLARPVRFNRFIDPLLILPLGASAVTLGLGFIITFNKPLFFLQFVLITSPLLIPIAHTVIALPFVIRTLQPALAAIPDNLRQAASVLGASPMQVWIAIDWPVVSRATLSSAAFAFTISLGEFGASSLIVRPQYSTLPVVIARLLSQPGGLNYGQAMAMSTILMVVCGMGIWLIERMKISPIAEL